VLLGSLKTNWLKAVKGKALADLPENFMDAVLSFKTVFLEIQKFLVHSDKYNS
jgi:hypothetical protein